ncbi:response regulator transcription factor [Aeromonas salmonicida]|uniref:response regulator transcription factor n=1 Tax=Aeromonas salmonicida TaxID=645 RepID=UPI00259D9211|nr:response regulator transcription factor [Aeromonas salmonicida]MDM5065438.1 response regulator transcription factor [Aeromonas salmonicida]
MMASVLIVDDHPAIRMAVRVLLQQANHTIIGEVDNGIDAIQMCKVKKPDIVILDIGIPMLDGVEVIKRVKAYDNKIGFIILSARHSHQTILRTYHAGAYAFISKMDELSGLNDAVDAFLGGNKLFYRDVVSDDEVSGDLNVVTVLDSLSDREMAVLLALCKGLNNKEIANDMLLSEKTISSHKRRLMDKLRVSSMVELFEVARQKTLYR